MNTETAIKTRAEVDRETEGFRTTFATDFAIANAFGESAVRGTFRRAFAEWKSDYRYLTHLVVALNGHLFSRYFKEMSLMESIRARHPELNDGNIREFVKAYNRINKRRPVLQYTYDELWRKADAYAYANLKGEELAYFVRITD